MRTVNSPQSPLPKFNPSDLPGLLAVILSACLFLCLFVTHAPAADPQPVQSEASACYADAASVSSLEAQFADHSRN